MEIGKAPENPHAGRLIRRYLLLGVAFVGAFSPLVAFGESAPAGCVAVSSAGLIDARSAAVAGDAVIVVETRDNHTMATAEAIIDTAREVGTLMIFR